MKLRQFAALSAIPLQLLAAATQAGFAGSATTTVTAGPTPPPPPPGAPPAAPDAGAMDPAVPVPMMDNLLLVVVGLLLAVIAIRFLRNSKGAQKLLSMAALGASLVVAGVGTERTIAQAVTDYNIAPECEGVDILVDAIFPGQIVNDCDTAQDIQAINTVAEAFDECAEMVVLPENEGSCMEGATLEPTESCTTDVYTIEYSDECLP